MERVAAYIDGFNLYNGMKDAHGRKWLWLDLEAMCRVLLRPDQSLESVTYFTAKVQSPLDSQSRQNDYLDALAASTCVVTVLGRFQMNPVKCHHCGKIRYKPEEKKTDVAIATHLVRDAYLNHYDAAMVVSGDSDMVPPVEAVAAVDGKRVIVVSPPKRQSDELRRIAGAATYVSPRVLRNSQLADDVTVAPGVVVSRPAKWV